MHVPKSLENKLVLLLSNPKLNTSEVEELNYLLRSHLDWPKVIGLLFMNRIVGPAWRNIKNYGDIKDDKNKFTYLFKILGQSYKMQKYIVREQQNYIGEICNALNNNKIQYVLLKGIILSNFAYEDIGERIFNDIDILINSDQISEAVKVLDEIGYIQGKYDHATKNIVPSNRRELVTMPLISHQIQPLIKKVDSEFLNYIKVDIQFSLDLMTNNKTDELVESFIKNRKKVELREGLLFRPEWEDMLIFCCIHFYKEANYYEEIVFYRDLLLYKILDLYQIIYSQKINWNQFCIVVDKYNLKEQIYYALHFVNTIYNCVPNEVLDKLSPNDKGYIDEIKINEYTHIWNDNIVDRIFDVGRAKIIEEKSIK